MLDLIGGARRRAHAEDDVTEPVLSRVRAGPGYPLGWVTALAAVVAAFVPSFLHVDPFGNADSRSFEALAQSLLAGRGFVYHEPMFPQLPLYAFRSVGYSAFLALFLSFGVPVVVAVQGALHGVSAALLGDVARRMAGTRAAWITFAIALVWPSGWFYAGQVLSETFLVFTLITTLWLAMNAAGRRSLGWAAAAGIVGMISIYTRPTGIGPVAVLVAWLALRFPRGALVMAVAAFLLWLPWPIRNYARLGAFVPFQTTAGVNFYNTHSENEPEVAWKFMARHPEMDELELERHFMNETRRIIRADPWGFAGRLGRMAIEYVGPILDRRPEMWFHRFAMLALLPALFIRHWRRRLALPVALWIAFGILILPIAVNVRYRFPLEWCVILAAAFGIVAAWERWGGRRAAMLVGGGLTAAIALTLVLARP